MEKKSDEAKRKLELEFELLDLLERKYGVPIQLKIETPDPSSELAKKALHLGYFSQRPAQVTKVERLNPEYERDLSLIVGEYPKLTELFQKVNNYNILYQPLLPGSAAQKAAILIENALGVKLLEKCIAHNYYNYHKINLGMEVDRNAAEKILQENNITHFQHHLSADFTGVYDKIRSSVAGEKLKVAEIRIEFIKESLLYFSQSIQNGMSIPGT